MTLIHLYVAIAMLLALDSGLTIYALRRFPRRLAEGNGVMVRLIAIFGRDGALVLSKVAAFALVWWLQPAPPYLVLIAVVYVGVVVWNAMQIRRALKASP